VVFDLRRAANNGASPRLVYECHVLRLIDILKRLAISLILIALIHLRRSRFGYQCPSELSLLLESEIG